MRKFLIPVVIALGFLVGVVQPASASVPCNGGSSCDETVVTLNSNAQFILNVPNCISSTNHDIDGITVYNNSSDHQRHAYVVQVRREFPVNGEVASATIFADYQQSVNWQANIGSVDKSQKLYAYVRDGNGFIQRQSVYHLEGDGVWTQGTGLVYPYNTYSCA